MRCLHLLFKKTNVLKPCERNVLLGFLCVCMRVLLFILKKEAAEAGGQTELGKMGVPVAKSLLESWLHTSYCNSVLSTF